MTLWVIGGFKDREENILQNLLKVVDHVLGLVNIAAIQSIIVEYGNVSQS